MPTFNELIEEHILRLNPLATAFVAIFETVSRAVVSDGKSVIYIPWGNFGRIVFVAESPFNNDELGHRSPAGIRYYVASAAPDQETAMHYLVYVASRLHTIFQISANAAAYALKMRLMTVFGKGYVPFRELVYEPPVRHPLNSRILDVIATAELCKGVWHITEERVGRAAVQYELALRRLEQNEDPLALAHLYMGVETLTKAVIRHECAERGVTERELGKSLGLDSNSETFGRQFEPEVRKQLIFQGDIDTYQAAKRHSDGLEHGFATWEDIWSVPASVFPKTAQYFRQVILRLLKPPDEVKNRLLDKPFDEYVRSGPTIAYEGKASISSIDLRATSFRIANVKRKMVSSEFDAVTGEYRYEYTLVPSDSSLEANEA